MATNSNHVTSAPADDDEWCHLQCLLASHGAPPPTEYDVMEEVSQDYVHTRELFAVSATHRIVAEVMWHDMSSDNIDCADDALCDCPTSDDDVIGEVPQDFLQNRGLSMLSATELAARTVLMRDDSLDTTCPLNDADITGVFSELSERVCRRR
jgi:hypothetical protein